jgi:hypothetical protein
VTASNLPNKASLFLDNNRTNKQALDKANWGMFSNIGQFFYVCLTFFFFAFEGFEEAPRWRWAARLGD